MGVALALHCSLSSPPKGHLHQFQVLHNPLMVFLSLVHSELTGHPHSMSSSQYTLVVLLLIYLLRSSCLCQSQKKANALVDAIVYCPDG